MPAGDTYAIDHICGARVGVGFGAAGDDGDGPRVEVLRHELGDGRGDLGQLRRRSRQLPFDALVDAHRERFARGTKGNQPGATLVEQPLRMLAIETGRDRHVVVERCQQRQGPGARDHGQVAGDETGVQSGIRLVGKDDAAAVG